jgi:4'-phosphopantetheinyl transferase superfamily
VSAAGAARVVLPEAIAIPVADDGAPQIRLLDGTAAGLDERRLRAWAREQTAAASAPFASRSYRHPYAIVAWHTEPVGIDIERIEKFKPEFLDAICTPEERSLPVPEADAERYATALWTSKEALSKALGDPLRYEPARLGSPMFWPEGRSGPWRAAELRVPAGHNGWLCWRSPIR